MTPIAERLRHETRSLHEQTEQLFYIEELQNGTLSLLQYGHLLRTHLVFHRALEHAIEEYPSFFQRYEPLNRQKTGWLLADLASLKIPQPVSPPELFTNWSDIALLGAAYVGEGSMLGGTIIWKLLQQNKELEPFLKQARFYQGYGSETGSYWRKFGNFLMEKGSETPDEVIEAAKQTFLDYQGIFKYTAPISCR